MSAIPAPTLQPDVKLVLDEQGVIQSVSLSTAVPQEGMESWIGRHWQDTIADGEDKVSHMVEDALRSGVSAFRQVNQLFPGGLELPIEYTTIRLEDHRGLMAVGKSLEAVAELQSRLIAAQRMREQDYWKLREMETRCRLLFDTSADAVLLIRAATSQIVEANPAASRAFGLAPRPAGASYGRSFIEEVAPEERADYGTMLLRVRDEGRAPGMLLHLTREREPWLIRATAMTSQDGLLFLLQLSPAAAGHHQPSRASPPLEALLERAPDAFAVLDGDGTVLRANRAFVDFVQAGTEGAVVGQPLTRWLVGPGTDSAALLASLRRHGTVKRFDGTLQGELGTQTRVDISAVTDVDADDGAEARFVAVFGRDVVPARDETRTAPDLGGMLGTLAERVGDTPLRELVRDTTEMIERHFVEAALARTGGNRTAAAELLGLSRQSLYAKLNRYGLDGGTSPAPAKVD